MTDFLKIFPLHFTLFIMIQNSGNSPILLKTKIYQKTTTNCKCNSSNVIWPKANMENSIYRKLLNLNICRNSFCLHISLEMLKISALEGAWDQLGEIIRFYKQKVKKYLGKSKKIKQNKNRKLRYLVLRKLWSLFSKIGFRKGDYELVCVSTQCWDFLFIFKFPQILSLKWFDNSWGNSYKTFLILDINFRFTFGEQTLTETQ